MPSDDGNATLYEPINVTRDLTMRGRKSDNGRTRRLPYATMLGRPVESMLSTSSAGRGGLNR